MRLVNLHVLDVQHVLPHRSRCTAPQILPLDGLNLNQMNLREALFAASAAQQLPRDRAAPASGETPGDGGLSVVTAQGSSTPIPVSLFSCEMVAIGEKLPKTAG